MFKRFPFYKQYDGKDCGPTCLKIICKYYGKKIPVEYIRKLSETTREGSSLLGLLKAAKKLGINANGIKTNLETLSNEIKLPCIIHWNNTHFVVIYKIEKIRNEYLIYVSDPSHGLLKYKEKEFLKSWINSYDQINNNLGVVLTLEPTDEFYKQNIPEVNTSSFFMLYNYLFKHKGLLLHIILGLIIGNLVSLIFPLLTKNIVDIGINDSNLNFVYLLLLAQFMIFIGNTVAEVIRNWLVLHLSAKINLSIISDFLIKLMKLPISFFDTRLTGDILQRINDHRRIEQFLTNSSLNTIFSLFNLIVYGIILLVYNYQLFIIFIVSSFAYIFWIFFFLKKRKELDYKRFNEVSIEQGKTIELINGMQEIKMHNAEKQKRWAWEQIQVSLFKINLKSLSLEQWQTTGGNFINQLKDILMSAISAKLVIDGNMTIGMMLSIQYIIGQLDNPLTQLIEFLRNAQNAKISFDRLKEIHDKEEENYTKIVDRQIQGDIKINNLTFRYDGSQKNIFEDLNIVIPYKKTTAIVGASGSGKTTLLKLLLKFYIPQHGCIKVGKSNLESIASNIWRNHCGVVMQEGFIFNDSIENNIAVGENVIDNLKLQHALETANLNTFVDELALGHKTKIGNEGLGISGGQKQRILIARAVYKSPDFIFFDEATSSLDANNENEIIKKLNAFLKGKTAIIIAHRLSTVKNADKIIVIDNGKIIEEGNHNELLKRKGKYFNLVKNQLELGN